MESRDHISGMWGQVDMYLRTITVILEEEYQTAGVIQICADCADSA